MSATTTHSAGFLLYLRGTAAILMTITGFAIIVGGILYAQIAGTQRYIGVIEGCAILLVFAGIVIALKTAEKLQTAIEENSLTD